MVVEGQTYRQNDATVSMKKHNVAGMAEGGEDDGKHVCVSVCVCACVQDGGGEVSGVTTSLLSVRVRLVG